jgi:hypothetical protein
VLELQVDGRKLWFEPKAQSSSSLDGLGSPNKRGFGVRRTQSSSFEVVLIAQAQSATVDNETQMHLPYKPRSASEGKLSPRWRFGLVSGFSHNNLKSRNFKKR